MRKQFITFCFLCLGASPLNAQESPLAPSEESAEEDKAYTAYAICAGYYALMVDEFMLLPQAPEIDSTIAAYQEAGEVSLMLATTFATIDYAAELVESIVAAAITRETENLQLLINKDVQLVGSLYDMICERMIDEGMTALAG